MINYYAYHGSGNFNKQLTPLVLKQQREEVGMIKTNLEERFYRAKNYTFAKVLRRHQSVNAGVFEGIGGTLKFIVTVGKLQTIFNCCYKKKLLPG